jgi:hypothetical protein
MSLCFDRDEAFQFVIAKSLKVLVHEYFLDDEAIQLF